MTASTNTTAAIVWIRQIFDDIHCKYKYELTLECDDKPELRLGDCEIIQK